MSVGIQEGEKEESFSALLLIQMLSPSPAEKNTDGGEETGEFENPVVKNTFFIMCSL